MAEPEIDADRVAGEEKAAALEENLDRVKDRETLVSRLDRIESKLDELLARGA